MRLRRFSCLANLLLLEGLGDLLEGPNSVQCPFIRVPQATDGRRITTIISRKQTFILPKEPYARLGGDFTSHYPYALSALERDC